MLLRILVLVVLSVVSGILLGLLVVIAASAASIPLTVTGRAVAAATTAIARSPTIARLGRTVSGVLRGWNRGLPDLRTTPRRDVGTAGSDVVAG